MRIICGLTQRSEGSYTLLGKTNDDTVRHNMGMLSEKPGIYEHMTALENLRIFHCCLASNLKIIIKSWKWSDCKTLKKESTPIFSGHEAAIGQCNLAAGKYGVPHSR